MFMSMTTRSDALPISAAMTSTPLRIAVLVPCYNAEAAVATVVADFRTALPSADVYVYDNKIGRASDLCRNDIDAASYRRAGALLQRGGSSCDRRRRFPQGAAVGGCLCL